MIIDPPNGANTKLGGYDFYREVLKSPKYVVAPMVDQSEYAWRILSRRYGAQLCYTPMLHARLFAEQHSYAPEFFTTGEFDRPLIVQFCANDPKILLKAALAVQPYCDAVDINLGCPQGIARKGHYGAFLMEDWKLIASMITILHENLNIPVTCKIRVYPDVNKSIEYAKMVQDAGCQLVTVHGRMREQKGQFSGVADWEQIRRIKQELTIPVFANGNILYYEDVQACLDATGADGVMSAEGNLYNPALFANKYPVIYEIAQEFLDICTSTPKSSNLGCIKSHLFKIFHPVIIAYPDLREQLNNVATMADCQILIDSYKKRMQPLVKVIKTFGTDEGGYMVIPEYLCQPYIRDPTLGRNGKAVKNGDGVEDGDAGVDVNGKRKLGDGGDGPDKKGDLGVKVNDLCRCGVNLASNRCTQGLCRACCGKLGTSLNKRQLQRQKLKARAGNGGMVVDENEIDWVCQPHMTRRK
ncbi:hypothetical protein SmJEL517_g03481 [Synchytrium microbalum]|uniref:tRNA-dihydrouridine(16/17) synthase [NAD(P)(+)] n=1 Tax=Synchytrium microbalum TaxID=1806994 RepID=A0A507C6X4_9FUNG|nr:uncharacterized protein SmJEL517_g03481 [Synchytrium microbalum]TPX33736.1 hypothetical protein SmJEL517_g03481 [Synchytrium microbalum]